MVSRRQPEQNADWNLSPDQTDAMTPLEIEQHVLAAMPAPSPTDAPGRIRTPEEGISFMDKASTVNAPGYADENHRWAYIWDVRTGVSSRVMRYMLPLYFAERDENGQPIWTSTPMEPKIKPTYPCMLHPESPDRKRYDDFGLPKCRTLLMNPTQVRLHMQSKHKVAWSTLERERQESHEDRQMRHMEMMSEIFQRAMQYTASCQYCGQPFVGESEQNAKRRVQGHEIHCSAKQKEGE